MKRFLIENRWVLTLLTIGLFGLSVMASDTKERCDAKYGKDTMAATACHVEAIN